MKKILIILTIIAAPWWLSAQSMNIESGAVVTIEVGASMTTGDITNTVDAGLVIKSDANGSGSLIGGGTPNATVQRFVEQNGWHLVTPITIPTTAYDFWTGTVDETWLAKYDPTDPNNVDDYVYITEDDPLTRSQGYSYWIKDGVGDQTVEFTGTLTSSVENPDLNSSGWTLVGNPFSSAFDWTKVEAGNTTGFAYVWDNAKDGYLYSTGGTPDVGILPGDIIPMGQGFFVEKGTLPGSPFHLPASGRVHNHTNGFIKSSNAVGGDATSFIRIDLDGGYYGNTVFVGFPENGTDDFDISGDATKLYSSTENVQFFAIENNDELCINANAPLIEGESKTVPLNLVQVTDGNYTMAFSDLNQLENATITLEDLKTNTTQNIRENDIYTFSGSTGDAADRFLLHFAWSPNDINEDIEDVSSNINIYAYGKDVYIRSSEDAINQSGEVFIYDLMGHKLVQQKIGRGELIKIPINITNNYAVVKVVKEGSVKIQKVYIK